MRNVLPDEWENIPGEIQSPIDVRKIVHAPKKNQYCRFSRVPGPWIKIAEIYTGRNDGGWNVRIELLQLLQFALRGCRAKIEIPSELFFESPQFFGLNPITQRKWESLGASVIKPFSGIHIAVIEHAKSAWQIPNIGSHEGAVNKDGVELLSLECLSNSDRKFL